MTTMPNSANFEPPDQLDGAEVLLWAYNPAKPFFIMQYTDGTPYKPIHGFAICIYKKAAVFYKFSCDLEWNVENDTDHLTIDEAIQTANEMSNQPIIWNKK